MDTAFMGGWSQMSWRRVLLSSRDQSLCECVLGKWDSLFILYFPVVEIDEFLFLFIHLFIYFNLSLWSKCCKYWLQNASLSVTGYELISWENESSHKCFNLWLQPLHNSKQEEAFVFPRANFWPAPFCLRLAGCRCLRWFDWFGLGKRSETGCGQCRRILSIYLFKGSGCGF